MISVNKTVFYSTLVLSISYIGTKLLLDYLYANHNDIPYLKNHRQMGRLPEETIQDTADELEDDDLSDTQDSKELIEKLYEITQKLKRSRASRHYGVTCNECSTEIDEGTRYLCTICDDYNLCSSCEKSQNHPKSHPLYVLPHHIPEMVIKTRIPTSQIPWQNPENIELHHKQSFSSSPIFQSYLKPGIPTDGFEVPDVVRLSERFLCLFDKIMPPRAERLDRVDQVGEAVITFPTFMEFLPTSVGKLSDPLSLFLTRFYDIDHDEVIDLTDFLGGTHLLLKSPFSDQLKRFLDVCSRTIDNEGCTIDHWSLLFQDLFSAYFEATKINFRKGMNLLTFDKTKYHNREKKPTSDKSQTSHLNSLLFEPRIEIDPSMDFTANSTNQKMDSEISLLSHVSAQDLTNEIFGGIEENGEKIRDELFTRIFENSKFENCIKSILQMAII